MMEWGFESSRAEVVRNFTAMEGDSVEPGGYGLYVGRMSSEKGIDVLLRALKDAGDPPFKIAGDGPVLEDLKQLAKQLELEKTEFLGRLARPDVITVLQGSRFVALPSLWDENAPLAALEAMALGRPLLVTATGGLIELVENGEGLVCPVGDVAALAAAIRELSTDDERCRELGHQALIRARREFRPEVHLHRLEEAYARVLAAPRTS
jgi:glycosyltransferase involved in cell wall biosynthesis